MRRNNLEIKIDILKKVSEHPDWSASRQIYSAGCNNVKGQGMLSDLEKEGLIIIRYKGSRRYTSITEKGIHVTRQWDEFLKRLGEK